MLDIHRERDPDTLRRACLAYDKANRQLVHKVQELASELAELKGIDAAQARLELPDVVVADPPPAPKPKPAKAPPSPTPQTGHGPTEQAELPIEPLHHMFDGLPDCESCGGEMEIWKGQFEDSEEITVVKRSFLIRLHRRQKYRCRCNGQVTTAPGPPKLIPGGRYSVEFAVASATDKFCNHMPLERQVRQMKREGLQITSQTLWDQQRALAEHLEPTWEALFREALERPILHVDETGWRMMGSKKNSRWTLFGLTAPGVAVYHLQGSKSAKATQKLLAGYEGTLVVDGYAVYPLIAQLEQGPIRIAHCWAHADRKFKDTKDPPASVVEIRAMIAQLYEIERSIEGPFPGDAQAQARRLALRNEKSRPLVGEIREWCFSQGGLRNSRFGKAVRYLLKYWDGLTVFLDDPQVPLDNNAAERALRGPVVGRKNFYGNRSKRGAKVAAILYTLIETAKLAGVDPDEYLRRAAKRAIERPGTVTFPR